MKQKFQPDCPCRQILPKRACLLRHDNNDKYAAEFVKTHTQEKKNCSLEKQC